MFGCCLLLQFLIQSQKLLRGRRCAEGIEKDMCYEDMCYASVMINGFYS
jgi:hypothetical protein